MAQGAASRSRFTEVIEMINRGELAAAEQNCRRAVDQNPEDVNMLGLLGALLVKMKNFHAAETFLRRTIDLAPTFAKPHEDLGYVLLTLNRPREAIPILERATRLDPALEFAHLNLGKALAATGRGREADEAFEKSFNLSPQRRSLAEAAACVRDGKYEDAEKFCLQVLQANPDNVDGLRLMANLAARVRRTGEAERCLRRAIEIAPDFTGAIVDLGKLLQEDDRFPEAIHCFRRAIEMEPENARFHDLLGYALAPASQTYEAIEAHRRATELDPNLAPAWLGLGHMLKTVGRQQEAIAAYHRCIKLMPNHGVVHWSLANLKTYRFTDEELLDMKSRVADENIQAESLINFLFALAKAYEDRDDVEAAWSYYRQGNEKRRMQETYDPVETEVDMDRTISVFDRRFLADNAGAGSPDPAPIFIVGLPRSGSTLIEQILASHSQVEGTSELPYVFRVSKSLNRNRANGINYPEAMRELSARHMDKLGQDYLDFCRIHRVEGKPRFIDKNPNNFQNVGFIHTILPNAKIIDARRHPMDACFSCYRQLFAKGQTFTYDLNDIGEYYLLYQRMMDYWHDVLPERVLTVQYEAVVSDLESQVRRILDYCGLPFEAACLEYYDTERPVRTASSEQVRQPIYTGSLQRWRKYEHHLDELKTILAPVMDQYAQFDQS